MFKIIVTENYDELSEKAFEVMKEVITSKSNPVLGLATGSSPIGLYQNMIKDHKENGTSYKNVVTFNLDAVSYTHLSWCPPATLTRWSIIIRFPNAAAIKIITRITARWANARTARRLCIPRKSNNSIPGRR